MTSIRPLGLDKSVPDKSGPEKYAPDRRPAERPAAERPSSERPALTPERPVTERLVPERLGDIDQAAANAFEGEIREFVRRDVNATRRAQTNDPAPASGDPVTDNLNNLIRRVSGASMEEIDRVMSELQSVRDLLRSEGERVSREVAGYASLSHAARTAMTVIADSITQWKGEPAALPTGNPAQPTKRTQP